MVELYFAYKGSYSTELSIYNYINVAKYVAQSIHMYTVRVKHTVHKTINL